MPYNKTAILSTREEARGGRILGQVCSVPNGKIDKVSLFLEPSFLAPEGLTLLVSLYDVDSNSLPTGSPLAQASISTTEITTRRFYNFAVSATTGQRVAVTLAVPDGDASNFVGWRYVQTSAVSEPLLITNNSGVTWVADMSRKFAYIAYSQIPDVITYEDSSASLAQTAKIQAGTPKSSIDDSTNSFGDPTLTRAVVDGSNIVISFGDFVVSMVVDMSGSMTWNDRKGLRLQFMKAYIDDMEAILPSSSQALYSIVKFNSRRIGRMRLLLQSGASGSSVAGVRIVRKSGALPVTGPTDGVVIFEGLAEEILDAGLVSSTQYQYGAFSFDDAGNFSEAMISSSIPQSTTVKPIGVAGFNGEEEVVENSGFDIGKRMITLSWSHPQTDDITLQYDKIYLVRREDRPPESPADGTVLISGATSSDSAWDSPYHDFDTPFVPAGSPKDHSDYPVAGLTYYYAMFTENSLGTRCLLPNAGKGAVKVSEADRFWEKSEPPFDDPVTYGFDDTPPSPPTTPVATIGDEELSFSWAPSAARYVVYYKPDEYPKQVDVDGRPSYDGDVVFDGSAASFVHRGLDNGQPHFYVIVAFDSVANMSTGIPFAARPAAGGSDTISPASVRGFEAEPYNSTTNRLSWVLPLSDATTFEGWFGDSVQAICNVAFADSDPRTTSATLEFIEASRSATTIMPDNTTLTLTEAPDKRISPTTTSIPITSGDQTQQVDITGAITPSLAMNFGSVSQNDTTTISSTFEASPLLSVVSNLEEVSIQFHGLLSVKDSAGKLITGVKTGDVDVKLKNPFSISIKNEPAQFVNRPKWNPTCNDTDSPKRTLDKIPGVYAGTGNGFALVVEASFRDLPLETGINLTLRIIDKITSLPSSVVTLPNTNSNGEATFATAQETDEVLDRSGQPTGETQNVTRVRAELPPQASPGDYVVEVTGAYRGYSRTVTMDVHYETPLNIDLDLSPFVADGINVAEQKAFVYYGDPTSTSKVPVQDLTITDWKLSPLDAISKKNLRKRPFYSKDGVPGTGVRAYAKGGTAKNVFFGPSVDIGPETSEEETLQEQSSCVVGQEIYEVAVTAKAGGFSRTDFGFITLSPGPEAGPELNRIFLRKVSAFNKDIVFSDGIEESTWEVLADPTTDGVLSDKSSGIFFHDSVTALGGLVPQLDEGKVVTLTAKLFRGDTDARIYIRTDLTGPEGRPWYAKATITNGRALFHLRLNTKVSGEVVKPPGFGSDKPGTNIVYGDSTNIGWSASPLIFSLSAYVPVEVGGNPVTFYGGGGDLELHTPPCFLSFNEPLSLGTEG